MPVFGAVRALIPVIVTILSALISRRVVEALCLGILSAALIAHSGDPIASIVSIVGRVFDEGFSLDHIYTVLFLLTLGGLIEILTHSGGLQAYTATLSRWITTKRTAEGSALLLSSFLFIDDYLNSLMVGAVMRPLTDRFNIPRVKLAYLINAMSGSLAVLVPASSWVAMSLAQIQNSGVSLIRGSATILIDDPYRLYCSAISSMFYPIFSIISAVAIVGMRISYGHMARSEGETCEYESFENNKIPSGDLTDLALPIVVFLLTLFSVLLITGGAALFGGEQSITAALQQGNPFVSLFIASVFGVVSAVMHLIYAQRSTYGELVRHLRAGALLMKNSCIILILAWTFGSYLRYDLQAGQVLADIVLSYAGLTIVPLVVFIAATLITAVTGSAWGAIAILVPLVIPLAIRITGLIPPLYPEQVPLLVYSLGAIFSGSIAGGHISPLTDASIMAATSARASHLEHIVTQIPYIIPALFGTILAYLMVGFGCSSVMSGFIGLVGVAALGAILNRILAPNLP